MPLFLEIALQRLEFILVTYHSMGSQEQRTMNDKYEIIRLVRTATTHVTK